MADAAIFSSSTPSISIGIPTYNRAAGLRVALASALAQDHPHLEIIVSDNASTDDTPGVLEEFRRSDSRVRVVRHETNRGPTRNFEAALQHATGSYFMWLADDDWLGPGYARRCLEELERNPDHSLVAGKVLYYKQGQYLGEGQQLNMQAGTGSRRLLQYYRQVGDNGGFYGLMRRNDALQIPLQNALGGDWLFLASVAFLGKVRTVTDVNIHRDHTWDDTSFQRYVSAMGLPPIQARHPYLNIATSAYRDIRHSAIYQNLGSAQRWWLACRVWRVLCRRHGLRLPKLLKIYLSEPGWKPA